VRRKEVTVGERRRFGYPILTRIGSAAAVLVLSASVAVARSDRGIESVLGTWTGTSICFGDRPACKNETVVYRLIAVEGKPGVVALYADKIVDGKRLPMGKFDFAYKEADRSLTTEFNVGSTHGLIELFVSGDTMTGKLLVLPEKKEGRNISVHRVSEDKVPPPPGLDEYER